MNLDRAAFSPPDVSGASRKAFLVGIVGLVLFAVMAAINPRQFFVSYLVTYVFWLNMASGCITIMLIHHLSGGAWGVVIRRILEAGSRTIPLMAILFIPIIIGMHSLYSWTHADVVAKDELLQHKQPYLNETFFVIRAIIYFVLWIGIATIMNKWSLLQETIDDPVGLARRMRTFAGPALLLQGMIVTFASIDWLMSLEPHWISSVYPPLIGVAQMLSALALCIIVISFLSSREPMAKVLKPVHFHDNGKLMLAFVMLWAYLSFSQLLIQWSGNLAEETPWYLRRISNGWQFFATFLILFHFVLPFLLLLSRDLKRNPRTLAMVAAWLILMRFVDLSWIVNPALRNPTVLGGLTDVIGVVAIGGLWIGFFLWQLGRRSILPLGEPQLQEALSAHG